jgi:hypothetical protein
VGTVQYRYDNTVGKNSKGISLTLPAGSYVLTASMVASADATSQADSWATATVQCSFSIPGTTLEDGLSGLTLFNVHRTASSVFANGRGSSSVPLTLTTAGTVTFSCFRSLGTTTVPEIDLAQARIQAVPVGGVQVQTPPS